MILFVPNLCLVLYMFTKVSGNEVTPKTDPLTTSNNAKSITVENQNLDLDLDKTKDHTTKATEKPPSKFDMKDFKVTKLQSNHNEENLEDCLASADPDKVEAVRKILKNDGGINYVTSEPLHLSDEEAKIAACLKKENTKTNTITTDMKGDNKTATKTPLETVEEVEMNVEEQAMNKRRRDTEYQFDPLEYYDDTVTFDPTTCNGDVEVFDLEIAELKQYDVECELLTHWIGLIDNM